MKRVLFLDFDGVLNQHPWRTMMQKSADKRAVYLKQPLMVDHVQRLSTLQKQTQTEVVLSTAWRVKGLLWCKDALRRAGFAGPVIDTTPVLGTYNVRGLEIKMWLQKQRETIAYVVLDDDRSAHVAGNHVLINGQDGLQDHHVVTATEIFTRDVARLLSFSAR